MKLTREKRIEIQKELKESKLKKENKDLINRLLDDSKLGLKLYFEEAEETVKNDFGNEVNITKQNYILFEEIKELRKINDDSKRNHLLIEGDNYLALKHLKQIGQKIDIIYIDPPYNTGKKDDFVYNDQFIDKENLYRHSLWLSSIKRRLEISKDLLNEDGIIFISIDDNEQAYLKVLMDEIFGEENFIENVITQSNTSVMKASNYFRGDHEYVLVYAKNINKSKPFNKIKKDESFESTFKNPDKDINGKWISTNAVNTNGKSNIFKIKHPTLDIEYEYSWKFSKEEFENGNIALYFNPNTPHSKPRLKLYWKNYDAVERASSLWIKNYAHNYESFTMAKNHNLEIFEDERFETPKPAALIKDLITMANTKEDSVILDFYAGSSTTGEAVLQYNKENNKNLKYIGITLGKTKLTKTNICKEVAYEKMFRLNNGIGTDGEKFKWADKNDPYNENLKYIKLKLLDKFNGDFQDILKNNQLYKEEFKEELNIELIADE